MIFKRNNDLVQSLEDTKLHVIQLQRDIASLSHDRAIELKDLHASHKREVDRLMFEAEFADNTEIKELRKTFTELDKAYGILTKENDMHKQILELDADIIDVKTLISELMAKLPTVNISGLLAQPADKK